MALYNVFDLYHQLIEKTDKGDLYHQGINKSNPYHQPIDKRKWIKGESF